MTEQRDDGILGPNGFILIQGNRLENLRTLLTTWVQRHPLHPLENEVVLVQSNGIGQWLKLALAAPPDTGAQDELNGGGCGIAAAIHLMLPGSFLWQVYRAVLGDLPEDSTYHKTPLGWRLYRLLGDPDRLAQTPEERIWIAPLRGFLSAEQDPRRRHQLAMHLADLYDQYQVYRAQWLAAWQRGDDALIRLDGGRSPLPDDQRWQPLLWRRLKQDLMASTGDMLSARGSDADGPAPRGVTGSTEPVTGIARDANAEQAPRQHQTSPAPYRGAHDVSLDAEELSRAEVHERFLTQVRALGAGTGLPGLPRRVIVFGISSLPRQTLEALEAIAHLAQVILCVHNPCRHYWGDIIEGRELFHRAYRRTRARKIPEHSNQTTLLPHGHPLLAAWGKQGRDYIRLLDEHDQPERYAAHFHSQNLDIDLFESPGQATLLEQLQDDILELRPLEERCALQTRIDPCQDRSIEFVVAHSRQREIEILHDQLLDAFARAEQSGRPLPPRDILVMVPEIADYAPHIEAIFGRFSVGDRRHIPFHVADRSARQRNPLLAGLERLMNLPQSRLGVSELLDLLDIPALRARFRLDESDLPLLRQWIEGANIRWGLHAEQRAGLGLPEGLEQNTWEFGLHRMLLGFASGDSGPWQGVEPFDDIGGLESSLVGALASVLEALTCAWETLQQPRTALAWSAWITSLLGTFFMAVDESDELALTGLQEALEQWVQACERGGADQEELPLEVVRESLLAGLDEPRLSQRFLAGAVNFATLMPMRAIPFRQIWLLGMNDGDYPRQHRPAGFDLMALTGHYQPGDRSRREDDRYLFLEALLSAREKLAISWVGRNIRDNEQCPPSVLVSQLRDHIAAGWDGCAADDEGTTLTDESAASGTSRTPASLGAGNNSSETGPTRGARSDAPMAAGRALVAALTSEHPLQPFSRRYFEPGRAASLFTYAVEWEGLHAKTKTTGQERESPPRLEPPTLAAPLDLSTLTGFLKGPVPFFYAERLSVQLNPEDIQSQDEEPFDIDSFASWTLHDRLITCIEQQRARDPLLDPLNSLDTAITTLARTGALPFFPFDRIWIEQIKLQLAEPLRAYMDMIDRYPRAIQIQAVHFEARGLMLEDSLSQLREDAAGNRILLSLQASRLQKSGKPRWHQLIRHWPRHLAAQLDQATTSHLFGPESALSLKPLDRDQAANRLADLMDAVYLGLSELLPLACRTSLERLRGEYEGTRATPAETYEGNASQGHQGERDEHPGYRRFWPDYATLSADERFQPLIDRLYRPLFEHLIGPEET